MWLKLIPYICKIIWTTTFVVALVILLTIITQYEEPGMQALILAQYFGKLAFVYLLASLFASPLYIVFPKLPGKPLYIKARKAIGTSAFFLALIHSYYAFFGVLGGFAALKFLDQRYLWATIFGSFILLILAVLATTSITYLVHKLGKHWKPVHRFVYLVALLVPIHALLIGSDFQNPNDLGANLLLFASLLLLMLEQIRFYKYLLKKYPLLNSKALVSAFVLLFCAAFYVIFYSNIFIQHG